MSDVPSLTACCRVAIVGVPPACLPLLPDGFGQPGLLTNVAMRSARRNTVETSRRELYKGSLEGGTSCAG